MSLTEDEVANCAPEVHDSAAASELTASAAQLRLLMQKLISTRFQGRREQTVSSADDILPLIAPNEEAHAASTIAGTDLPVPRTPAAKAAEDLPTVSAACAETPGLSSLAAQARDLLYEIEAAAAGSPCLLNHRSPHQQQQQTAATQQGPPVSPEQQQVQQPDSAVKEDEFSMEADAQDSMSNPLADADAAVWSAAVGCDASALKSSSMSLADSHTWSAVLQQYQLHRQQAAGLLGQQVQTVKSCGSSSKPLLAADSSCSPGGITAMPAVGRLTPPSDASLSIDAAAMQQHAYTAPVFAAATTPGSHLAAAAGCSSSPSETAAVSELARNQQQTPCDVAAMHGPAADGSICFTAHSVGAGAGDFDSKLSPDGLRLRVKALRGPLEDAMRCFTELQEAQEEVSLLRARNARMAAAAEALQAERSFLLAERKLQVLQLRSLAVLLAADAGPSSKCTTFAASQETAQADIRDAEQQLETCWRLLPSDSPLKIMAGPSQLARDFAALSTEFKAAVARKQQQVVLLRERLSDSRGEVLQEQQRVEQLQQQLIGVRQVAETTLQQEVAAVQAKAEKRVLKAEQKLLKLAQIHQAAVAEFQQQLQQYQDQLVSAQQQQERLQEEQQALQQRIEQLETQRDDLQERVVVEKAAKGAAEDQVASLQAEQRQLLSALSALEASLAAAQSAAQDQDTMRQRLEEAVQAKALAVMEAKQELRDVKLAAQNAHAESQQLQQQLGSLRSKAADTARQLSAARTAAHDAQQEFVAEHKRMQQQAAVLDELRTELEKARRATAAAQKAQAAEVKRAAAAESAAAAAAHADLSAAQTAAAEAETALTASRKECKRLQQQCKSLQQQLDIRTAEQQKVASQNEQDTAALRHRAEAAEADLLGIRQDVAGWAAVRSQEQSELQETKARLAETSTDLGVALQKVAACGMPVRLGGGGRAAGSRPASACNARAAAAVTGAAGRQQQGRDCPDQAAGSQRSNSNLLNHQQQQHLPPEVAGQLQWQASEVMRLQGALHQLQQQYEDAQQQLSSSRAEVQCTKQQLEAAEDAIAWHHQQQQPEAGTGLLQQRRLQLLEVQLADADGRTAELTSQLAAVRSELLQQQRQHAAEVRQLQNQQAAAEAVAAGAQQQLQRLEAEVIAQHWQQQQQHSPGWQGSALVRQEWPGQQQSIRAQRISAQLAGLNSHTRISSSRHTSTISSSSSSREHTGSGSCSDAQGPAEHSRCNCAASAEHLETNDPMPDQNSAGVGRRSDCQGHITAPAVDAGCQWHATSVVDTEQAVVHQVAAATAAETSGNEWCTPASAVQEAAGSNALPAVAARDADSSCGSSVSSRSCRVEVQTGRKDRSKGSRGAAAHSEPAMVECCWPAAAASTNPVQLTSRTSIPADRPGRVLQCQINSDMIVQSAQGRSSTAAAGEQGRQQRLNKELCTLRAESFQCRAHDVADGNCGMPDCEGNGRNHCHNSQLWETSNTSSIDYDGTFAAANAALKAATACMMHGASRVQ